MPPQVGGSTVVADDQAIPIAYANGHGQQFEDSVRLLDHALVGHRRRRSLDSPGLDETSHRLYLQPIASRSEEHTSELQSLMRISYAVFCLKKKKNKNTR